MASGPPMSRRPRERIHSPGSDTKHVRYPVVLELDPATGTWVAEVPGIPGAYSQGRDKAEALEHVREALVLALAGQGAPEGYQVEFATIEA